MATKTYLFNFLLILFSASSNAQSDEQILSEWTKTNEQKLIEKYSLVDSAWFNNNCLQLAKQMKFSQINQCQLFKSTNINAYVFNNGHVYFSTAMMQLINNKHQWASILAHENAHIELNHYLKNLNLLRNPKVFFPKSKYKKQLKKHEKQADDWSEKKLMEFNLDPLQIYYFLKRVEKIKGNKRSNSHLKLSKRLKKNQVKEIINPEFDLIFE